LDRFFERLNQDFGRWGDIIPLEELFTHSFSPFKFVIDKGFLRGNTRLVFSVCSEEVNRLRERKTIEHALVNTLGEPFYIRTLAAYPIGDDSGNGVITPLIQEFRENNAQKVNNIIFFLSPHVGLTLGNEIRYGYLYNSSQTELTTCCEIIMDFLKGLRHLQKIEDTPHFHIDSSDSMKNLVYNKLWETYKEEIMQNLHSQDINMTIIKISVLHYELIMRKFKEIIPLFLTNYNFDGEYAVIGGITINTRDTDYFVFRDYTFNSF